MPKKSDAPVETWGAGSADRFKPIDTVEVSGDTFQLGIGEHPHSRSDNRFYARRVGGDNEDFVGFDGHRRPWHIEITESNYMKESELSGDEIRKNCSVKIYVDITSGRKLLFAYGARSANLALVRLPMILAALSAHPTELWKGRSEQFPELIGRKVYWRNQPAVVRDYLPEQGAVVIVHADGEPFETPAWRKESGASEPDDETMVKVELLSEEIWWYRKK